MGMYAYSDSLDALYRINCFIHRNSIWGKFKSFLENGHVLLVIYHFTNVQLFIVIHFYYLYSTKNSL